MKNEIEPTQDNNRIIADMLKDEIKRAMEKKIILAEEFLKWSVKKP